MHMLPNWTPVDDYFSKPIILPIITGGLFNQFPDSALDEKRDRSSCSLALTSTSSSNPRSLV